MTAFLNALNTVLSFAYDHILSIAMMVLMFAVGAYLTYRTRLFQFRKFGTVRTRALKALFSLVPCERKSVMVP